MPAFAASRVMPAIPSWVASLTAPKTDEYPSNMGSSSVKAMSPVSV
jgi:hypothetical protein